ncbi:hypothetical protein AURDEDRAFT_177710 [Auricularia subglabra TFB-10046 SS5]|uniref:Uncharacterized protein n=1 Tax=Auricularia subglabra (strain TFB-10046 / SS5) TaxID=717982 RepID=J0D3E8_AURST|nr:hypothetical protein AURDEDRAFT_177710 [Auricularia subglabra TFB-10046 SS5]
MVLLAAPARRQSTWAKPRWNGRLDEAKAALVQSKRALVGLPHALATEQAAVVRTLANRFKQLTKRDEEEHIRVMPDGSGLTKNRTEA